MEQVYSKKTKKHHYTVEKAEFNELHSILAPSEYSIYVDGEYVEIQYTKDDAIEAINNLIRDE